MTDRAHLEGETPDGGAKWCVFPCQDRDENGNRIKRKCRVSVDPRFKGNVWTWTGTREAPTLSPSINCRDEKCWHGFIVDGEVRR